MYKNYKLTDVVSHLPANVLGVYFEENVHRVLSETMCGKTYKEFGIVDRITKILGVRECVVSRFDGTVTCLVDIEVISIHPDVGDRMHVKVSRVYDHGIFFNVCKSLRVFVPTKEADRNVGIGDERNVEIMHIKLENNVYYCIGQFYV